MMTKIDLHNHSCLSPCADNDLTPGMLALEAMDKGVKILGLSDHNSGRNLPAFKEACETCSIVPVMGIEVNTREEVHVLGLFGKLDEAMDFSDFIESLLQDIPNRRKLFGDQLIINEEEKIMGSFPRALTASCNISFEDLIDEINSRGGLAIPAHIDRYAFSVWSNLGFLPDLSYSAVEAITIPPKIKTYSNTVIQSSDAHSLVQVGRRSCKIEMESLSFEGLKKALRQGKVKYGPFDD